MSAEPLRPSPCLQSSWEVFPVRKPALSQGPAGFHLLIPHQMPGTQLASLNPFVHRKLSQAREAVWGHLDPISIPVPTSSWPTLLPHLPAKPTRPGAPPNPQPLTSAQFTCHVGLRTCGREDTCCTCFPSRLRAAASIQVGAVGGGWGRKKGRGKRGEAELGGREGSNERMQRERGRK